jgi:hypothetical protein
MHLWVSSRSRYVRSRDEIISQDSDVTHDLSYLHMPYLSVMQYRVEGSGNGAVIWSCSGI